MTTIAVTGANRGIGLEFVRQYSAEGASIIACCRNPAKADKLKQIGKAVSVMALDVADSGSIAALARELKDEPIDILIDNAGVYGGERQSADDPDPDVFAQTFRVNSIAPLIVAHALKPNLMRGKDKKLAVLTSKMGSISDSSGGSLAYRASKAALNMIFHGVALEWAKDGIAVGILHPGWVKTDMGGPDAMITVEDSVTGLRARIGELNQRNSGRFVDYKGRSIGW
ncbi:MAG TPA: SDR family oxidoreductase [Rhizomicrobium sp.]|nr:SDR family oxidoreductase [Rhizomicrobium sp.]